MNFREKLGCLHSQNSSLEIHWKFDNSDQVRIFIGTKKWFFFHDQQEELELLIDKLLSDEAASV